VRLFLALGLPADVRDDLQRHVAAVRTTDPLLWHLTLVFLGDVADPEPLLPGVRAATAASPPLTLRLRGGGFFRRPGVLYAGLDGDVPGLRSLAAALEEACRDAGVSLEDRPYRPHVTVARRLARDAGVLRGYAGPAWVADEVEVVRSHLGTTVRHEVQHRMPMSG
jgi:2'-5' RNA ligase